VFNWLVLVGSVLVGLAAGLTALRSISVPDPGRALGAGALVGAGGSVLLLLAGMAITGADLFAVAHVVYGILTIAVPVAAGILATRWRSVGRWVRAAVGLGLLLGLVGLYATHVEPFWLRIDRHEVAVGTPGADGIRLGVFSDLQTPEIGDYENSAVEALLAEEPDIVLIPGDVWQSPGSDFAARAPQFEAVMRRISDAVPWVFVVNGNTDHLDGLRRITEGTGVMVLDNEVADLTVDGTPVRVLGISIGGNEADLTNAVEDLFGDSVDTPIRIVLAHQPDEIARFSPDDPIDLLVAGHTHGGQVAIPFIGPVVTLSSLPRAIAAGGLHRFEGHTVYVSTGVGRERLYAPQVRFGVRPSIGVLDLVSTP
jgi:predicted MPP superfamily phosphohydrolase